MNDYRRPTEAEAVEHLVCALTDSYRRQCINYWRKHYGDKFAEQVRRDALKRIKKGLK